MYPYDDDHAVSNEFSIGQSVRLLDGRRGRVTGFYFTDVKVQTPQGTATVPVSELESTSL